MVHQSNYQSPSFTLLIYGSILKLNNSSILNVHHYMKTITALIDIAYVVP